MRNLATQTDYEVSVGFRWKDRNNELHSPEDMETHHLFHVIKMVWNHSAPMSIRIQPYKHYHFGAFYTYEYMKEAMKAIGNELMKRDDLQHYMRQDLQFMRDNYWRFIKYRITQK